MKVATSIAVDNGSKSQYVPKYVGGSALKLWCRSDLGSSASWTDRSGNGNSLAGTSTISQNQINGFPAYVFDGALQFMTKAFTCNQPCTQFFIAKNVTIGGVGAHDVLTDGGALGTALLLQDSSPLFTMSAGAGLTTATRLADGVFEFWCAQFNGASSFFRRSGIQILSGNASVNNPGGLTIGALQNGTRPANVAFAECIVYSSALSLADIGRVEAYLKARYKL